MKTFKFIFVLLFVVSCKSETKKEAIAIPEVMEGRLQMLENPVKGNSSLPRLFSSNNKLFFSWVEKIDTLAILKYSVFEDTIWKDSEEIISGSDWFVNWADFPSIAETNGNILTSFLQKSAKGTYTYDVKLNLYNPEINTWKKNFILHNDGTQSEHGFVSILPYLKDSFFVTWLDGRNTAGGHETHENQNGGGAMTLRGAFVDSAGSISQDTELDQRICDCCQTSAAMTSNGPVVVYRDRSDEEIRDISIVRLVDGKWTSPQTIGNDHWKIAGCPVNGPSVDAKENAVAVAWFTATQETPKVQIAFSEDMGKTFGLPVRIDSGDALGRVDVTMISESEAIVSWMENRGDDTLIQLMKVHSNGTKSNPITISKTSAERASGFPQIEVLKNTVYVAWTTSEGETSSIKTASIALKRL
jgi:hypothetical protein